MACFVLLPSARANQLVSARMHVSMCACVSARLILQSHTTNVPKIHSFRTEPTGQCYLRRVVLPGRPHLRAFGVAVRLSMLLLIDLLLLALGPHLTVPPAPCTSFVAQLSCYYCTRADENTGM